MTALLEIENLQTEFKTEDGIVRAVDDVTLSVRAGDVLGLVSESGSGKTVTTLSVLRLIEKPGAIIGGSIRFDGRDVLALAEEGLTELRGDRISMIFQQPKVCLNPVLTVGQQIAEVFIRDRNMDKKDALDQSVELLRSVGIPSPETKVSAYPHELSGGQAQRVMIAIALALKPRILIADEPTTALDVTIQAQIIELLRALCETTDTALVIVTHDLGVIAEIADRVAVMYAGQIVEEASVEELFDTPQHPYTVGLMQSMPMLGDRRQRLNMIPGSVPRPFHMPAGCRFSPRCRARVEHGLETCLTDPPALTGETRKLRCWLEGKE